MDEEKNRSLTLNEYQKLAMRTLGHHPSMVSVALGLTGEAGEVADYVKKVMYHRHPIDRDKFIQEVGDVLWYVAQGAEAMGIGLEDIAKANIAKLEARYPNGFSAKRSLHREG